MQDISLILPTYNERDNIEKLINRIFSALKGVEVNYRVLCLRDRRLIADITEKHQVRFLFLPEINEFLGHHNMKMLHFCKWMQLDGHPSGANWNACVVACKV
ncbi:MAG: hypothetical protein ABII26_04050 [Pseudomonadota bacterium]